MRGLDVTTMSFVIAGGFLLTFMALYGVFGGFFAERRQPFVRDRAQVEDEIVDVVLGDRPRDRREPDLRLALALALRILDAAGIADVFAVE